MLLYEDRTPEQIKAEIIAALQSDEAHRKGGGWETREGSFADDQVGPMAVQLSDVYTSLSEVESIVWVTEDSGVYIDRAAEDLGIEPRKEGAKARVILEITGEAGYLVPQGAVFLTEEELRFQTLTAGVISEDGVALVEAEAQEIGGAYNVAAGSIVLQFDNAAEITAVTNPAAAEGGADRESDAALFARYDLARKKPRTSGNKYDYEQWALEVDGVGKAQVFPIRYSRGTVMVLIADENRRPVSQAIVDACTAHIEELMPCGGIELTVKTPTVEPVNVSAVLETDGSESLERIREAFLAALGSYFSEIALSDNAVVYNYVGALLIGLRGVSNYAGLLLNGEAQDIALTDEQVPEIGEVVLS